MENQLQATPEIFDKAIEKANQLKNESSKNQSIQMISALIQSLQNQKSSLEPFHLPKISLIENDNSTLVEWNFKKFRIGFSLEKDEDKSFCFFISHKDNSEAIGLLESVVKKINGNFDLVASESVAFVLKNLLEEPIPC